MQSVVEIVEYPMNFDNERKVNIIYAIYEYMHYFIKIMLYQWIKEELLKVNKILFKKRKGALCIKHNTFILYELLPAKACGKSVAFLVSNNCRNLMT